MKKIISSLIIFILFLLNGTSAFCVGNSELRDQAKVLYMSNNFEDAQERVLQIPESEKIAADYFLAAIAEKDPAMAIKLYERALVLDNTFYQAYYNIGSIYFAVDNYEKAIDYFKQAVKYNKKFAYGYYNIGCAYLELKEYNLARKNFEAAIKLNPEEPDYYYNLGYTYKKMSNVKRSEKAINLYNELIKKRNEN